MVDFHQNGHIATLHNLRTRQLEDMTYELETFGQTRKMSLILPCLYSELQTEAMPNILAELSRVTYLHRIIIGLDQADEDQFRLAASSLTG
jgi:glucosyl-3-phosphoglycerate synthase